MLKKHVKATNIELTTKIEEYLDKKIEPIAKFVDDTLEALARIELGKTTNHHQKGDVFRAEINLQLGKDYFRAVSESTDLLAAIDEMKDQIVSEVSKVKRKKIHLLKRGHQKIKNILRGVFRGN